MLVVDEVLEDEELMAEVAKDPRGLVTPRARGGGGGPGSRRGGGGPPGSASEERDLKPEPLVTVDEIGEVEELPLNEPTGLSVEDGLKQKEEEEEEEEEEPGDSTSCPVPEDPSALVTVDELHEEHEDSAMVTLDEVHDDDEDFLADFNRLKEELNFVTVDEVGEEDEEEEEEDERALPGENPKEGRGDEDVAAAVGPEQEAAAVPGPDEEDIVAVAGPEEMEILGGTHPEEEDVGTTSKGKGLDYLLPKAGFFCQICSLFYSDETSVKNHCRTALHQQNAERFMATQKEEESGGAEHGPR
ncbi:zinc finger protein 638-like [Numida meleagris]|uniref:zinc finger protein 638-like n=1 Tax=Numida meleagris TaxID=8996 RepID=UPI000B3DC724|nr:zinc finger protein 638-like [Numida meleagris]